MIHIFNRWNLIFFFSLETIWLWTWWISCVKSNRDFTLVWLVWFTHLLTRAEKTVVHIAISAVIVWLLLMFYCPHFFLMLLKLSIFVSIVDCSQCFGFVSALLWLTHHMRLTNREILMAKFQPFVDWFTGWFAFSSLILFHSLHTNTHTNYNKTKCWHSMHNTAHTVYGYGK